MLFPIILLSFIFLVLAFLLNPSNAATLLSGYNSLSPEEQKNFPIKEYLQFFKKFHLFLSGSLLVPGILFWYLEWDQFAAMFLSVYPLASYLFFIIRSARYYKHVRVRSQPLVILIVIAAILFVGSILYWGSKKDAIRVQNQTFLIEGMYSLEIPKEKIRSVELVDFLPELTMRTNGFAMGQVKKGYFLSKANQTIFLLVYSNQGPFLHIENTEGEHFYIDGEKEQVKKSFEELKGKD
jgi:hypothetical protein